MADAMRRLGALPLFITAVSWAINFSVIKLLLLDMPPPAATLLRFLAMAPILFAVAWVAKEELRLSRGDAWRSVIGGFFASGVYMILFMSGMKTAPAASGAIALATIPIFTSILASLAGQERVTARLAIGSAVAFSGVVVTALGSANGDGLAGSVGTALVLAAAVMWAISVIVMKPALERNGAFTVTAYSMLGAIPPLVIWAGRETLALDYAAVSARGWWMLAYFTIVAGVIGFLGFYIGVRNVGPSRATFVQYTVPPLAALCAWAILGDPVSFAQLAGLALVLAGVWYGSKRRPTS